MQTRRANHSVLQELGESVRVAYINQRRAWVSITGRETNYLPGVEWGEGPQSVWVKIAKFLRDNQIRDYPRFFQGLFERRGRRDPPPTPGQMHGPKALKAWKSMSSPQALEDARAQAVVRWDIEKRAFVMAVMAEKYFQPKGTDHQLLRAVIVDDTVELSPLYRYCVAIGEGLPLHASCYAETALRQYAGARTLYDEVWGGWIPEHLKEEAETVCHLLPEDDDNEA